MSRLQILSFGIPEISSMVAFKRQAPPASFSTTSVLGWQIPPMSPLTFLPSRKGSNLPNLLPQRIKVPYNSAHNLQRDPTQALPSF